MNGAIQMDLTMRLHCLCLFASLMTAKITRGVKTRWHCPHKTFHINKTKVFIEKQVTNGNALFSVTGDKNIIIYLTKKKNKK